MNPKVTRRERAVRDIIELADFIASDSLQAADLFLDALEEALHLLAERPDAGARRAFRSPALRGIRMWPIRGFEKHLVFYRRVPDGIEVIRVLRTARDISAHLFSLRGER